MENLIVCFVPPARLLFDINIDKDIDSAYVGCRLQLNSN